MSSRRDTSIDLPRMSLVGLEPPEPRRIVSVTRAGEIFLSGVDGRLSLDALEQHLGNATSGGDFDPDGASRLNVLLDVDASTPWNVSSYLMMICAHANLSIYRIYFGAKVAGGKAMGAVACPLDPSRHGYPLPTSEEDPPRKKKIKLLSKGDRSSSPLASRAASRAALWAALRSIPRELVPVTKFYLVVPPNGGSFAHGDVMGVLDVILRTGAKYFDFIGGPDGSRTAAERQDAETLARRIRSLREKRVRPAIMLDSQKLTVAPSSTPPLPPGGRVERIIGLGLHRLDRTGAELESRLFEREILQSEDDR